MNTLPTGPSWAGNRINYGKGRCAHVPKSQQAAVEAVQAAAAQSLVAHTSFSPIQGQGNFGSPMTPYSSRDDSGGMDEMNGMNDLSGLNGNQPLNRMIYLGDIHPETSTEDLCNTIGGGHQQNGRSAVGAVAAVAIAQHRSPQTYPPQPQQHPQQPQDHSSSVRLALPGLLRSCGVCGAVTRSTPSLIVRLAQ